MERLAKQQAAKEEIAVGIDACQLKLEAKTQQVAELLKTDNEIMKELKGMCGDSPFWEALLKTFKRKIKRAKVRHHPAAA